MVTLPHLQYYLSYMINLFTDLASKATSKTSNQDTFILRRPRIIIILLTSAKFQSCRLNKPLKTHSKSKESEKVYQNATFTFICICDIAKLVNFS